MTYLKSVFLVDNNSDDRHLFAFCVGELDNKIHLECEKDCERALGKLTDERRALPDVIFLDWNMPEQSGERCLKEFRKIPRLDSVPIIVLSTSSADQDKKKALLLGAFLFISKPVSLKELTALLKGIFVGSWSREIDMR